MPSLKELFGDLPELRCVAGGVEGAIHLFQVKALFGAEFDSFCHASLRALAWKVFGSAAVDVAILTAQHLCQCFGMFPPPRCSPVACRFVLSDQSLMRLSWGQHLQAARTIESHCDADLGTSLCLMGMALLMLAEDLLESELVDDLACSDR